MLVGKERLKIVLVDMDNVIADFDGAVEQELGVNLKLDSRTSFYMEDAYPELREAIIEIYSKNSFFLNMSPILGSLEALTEMEKLGHLVFICTSPLTRNPNCASDKLAWVMKHLGRAWVDRLIIGKDKTVIRGNILIDDRPEVTGLVVPSWEHVFFDRSWNRDVKGKRRLTWDNWREILEG